MRVRTIAALTGLSLLAGVSGAAACEAPNGTCGPAVVVWPLYTATGRRLGAVEAPVRRLPRLETSRFTSQPLTTLYDNPRSVPGSVESRLRLVPLPHEKRSSTVGAYPVGY